jgi:broad specificity phosphatase PhoE
MTTPSEQTWYIFRHGLATRSTMGYGDRIITAEVLPEGIPPVQRLGAYMAHLPYTIGWRSEFLRCEQTAAIVSQATGRAFTPDPRLNEMVHEPFEEVRTRIGAFVSEMHRAGHAHIWVCTHGIVIAGLRHWVTRGDYQRRDELDYIQPGQLLIIRPDKTAEVLKFDEVV